MAVSKGKYQWYNDENELMFGSISHKPDIYCYQETADWRYDCMEYRKEDIEKYRSNIYDMIREIKSAKILYCIMGFVEDIAEEDKEVFKHEQTSGH